MNPQDTGDQGLNDDEQYLRELSDSLRFAFFRILPIGIIISFATWALVRFAGLQEIAWKIAGVLLLLTILVVASFVSSKCLRKWFRRPTHSESGVHHEIFRLVTIIALSVTFSALVIVFLALAVLGVGVDTIIEVAGAVVLLFTIAVLVICSRYTAVSFSTDVNQLIREVRASGESLVKSYEAITDRMVRDLDANMDKVLDKLEEQGKRQASSLESLAEAVRELARVSEESARVAEEMRLLQEEAVELQEKGAKEAEEREKRREGARVRREEQDRKRMKPMLDVRMFYTGVVFHHLKVQVHNTGMTGYNLRINGYDKDLSIFSVSADYVASQGYGTWDIGDVGLYPKRARFDVVVAVADNRGRTYVARTVFSYGRKTGFLGRTVSVGFDPTGFVPLELHLQERLA